MTESQRGTLARLTETLDEIGPWLTDFGNWIFGALIGFNLVILGAVLTIGPEDVAVKIAMAATAFALPPSAVGIVLLRLVTDVRSIRASQKAAKAFHEAGIEETHRTRGGVIRRYAYLLMLVATVLTLVGLTAALWHGAWWIGLGLVVVLALSLVTLAVAAAQATSRS